MLISVEGNFDTELFLLTKRLDLILGKEISEFKLALNFDKKAEEFLFIDIIDGLTELENIEFYSSVFIFPSESYLDMDYPKTEEDLVILFILDLGLFLVIFCKLSIYSLAC